METLEVAVRAERKDRACAGIMSMRDLSKYCAWMLNVLAFSHRGVRTFFKRSIFPQQEVLGPLPMPDSRVETFREYTTVCRPIMFSIVVWSLLINVPDTSK